MDVAGEVPLAALGASSSGSQDSKKPGAIVGAVTECLGDRLTGSALTIAAEASVLGEELLAMAAFTIGASSSTGEAL